jgi:ABC-type branched-subunit amino acid transport system substrate-binding protein
MFRSKKLVWLLLAVFLLASGSLLWAGGTKEAKAVRIGALLPLTGPLSEYGAGFRKAGDMVTEQLLAAGFPVDLRYVDTETSAIPGVEGARTLVSVERVVALVGAAASGVTVPVAETVAIPNQVPIISYASTSNLITALPADQGKDFLFRTTAADRLQGLVLGQETARAGAKTAAVFYINSPYGQGLLEDFRNAFEAGGGKVVAAVPHDEKPAPTYVSELRQLMADKPDVMLALSYSGHATVYLKEFFEAGYQRHTALLFCDGTKSVDIAKAVGPENLAGYFGTAAAPAAGVSVQNFQRDFKAKFGELPPLPYIDSTYDAIVIATLAAAKAQFEGKPVNGVTVRDNLRAVANPPGEVVGPGVEGIKKALELLKAGKDINYEGAAGSQDFDENGDVVTPIEIWKFVENEPYIVTERLVE